MEEKEAAEIEAAMAIAKLEQEQRVREALEAQILKLQSDLNTVTDVTTPSA